jgi:hypothetical protein
MLQWINVTFLFGLHLCIISITLILIFGFVSASSFIMLSSVSKPRPSHECVLVLHHGHWYFGCADTQVPLVSLSQHHHHLTHSSLHRNTSLSDMRGKEVSSSVCCSLLYIFFACTPLPLHLALHQCSPEPVRRLTLMVADFHTALCLSMFLGTSAGVRGYHAWRESHLSPDRASLLGCKDSHLSRVTG